MRAIVGVLFILGLAGCSSRYSGAPVYTNAPNSTTQVPQSANSLPPGAVVSAPLTPGTGTVFRSGY